ncbi:MAG: c-type cytochrome biogenesis protein CcmI, partial [Pseudomonadota bacterium]
MGGAGSYLAGMLEFALAATVLTLATLAAVLAPLWRGAASAGEEAGDAAGDAEPPGEGLDRDASDTALYRDQLTELARDVERGTVSAAEAEGTRAEIARRLLAANRRAAQSGPARSAPASASRRTAMAALAATPVIAAAVYLVVGAPGAPDRPLAERDLVAEAMAGRLDQASAEAAARAAPADGPRAPGGGAEYAELVSRLEAVVAERPDDVQGHSLLASAYMRQSRFAEAWPVLDRLIVLAGGREAAPADLHAAKAEAMIFAADGYVSREAEAALAVALGKDAQLPTARYYAGHALAQRGEVERAVALWRRLEGDAPADAPWRDQLSALLTQARAEGVPTAGPPPAEEGPLAALPLPPA